MLSIDTRFFYWEPEKQIFEGDLSAPFINYAPWNLKYFWNLENQVLLKHNQSIKQANKPNVPLKEELI